jgi:hypothetical protein
VSDRLAGSLHPNEVLKSNTPNFLRDVRFHKGLHGGREYQPSAGVIQKSALLIGAEGFRH